MPRDPYETQQALLGADRAVVIVDAGAYVGDTAVRYAGLFPRAAAVHAFEPSPENYRQLVAFTRDMPAVVRHNAALADATGPRAFRVNAFGPTDSLLPRPRAGRRYFPRSAGTVREVTVDAVALDDWAGQHGVDHIDLLKMDIQGGELLALRGAGRLLREQRIDVVFTEVAFVPHYQDAPLYHHLAALLEPYDYGVYDLVPDVHARDGQLRYGEAIFLSRRFRTVTVDAQPDEP